MSADLFAAFGSETNLEEKPAVAQPKPTAQSTTNSALFGSSSPSPASTAHTQSYQSSRHFEQFEKAAAPASVAIDEENDDWGDFEGNSTVETNAPIPRQSIGFSPPPITQPQRLSWATSTSAHPFSFDAPNRQDEISTLGWQSAPIVKAKKPADSAILFDAEEEDDDDDFGDFEGVNDSVPVESAPQNQSALVDLMGDMDMSHPQPKQMPVVDLGKKIGPNRSTIVKKSPIGGFGNTAPIKSKASAVEPPAPQADDGWDEFDDWEASIPAKPSVRSEPSKQGSPAPNTTAISQLPSATINMDEPQPGELPPTNVPPPGVLLSLFPSLFNEAQEKLFKPMAAQPLPLRNKLMAEPTTVTFLQGYLVLTGVAARVIAGRKLRWKRDSHLSQGMRIGPASSRATSGMKLTGIDKGENMKEEREVADVVRVWKDQVGRLRHVVSGVNQIRSGTLGQVPDLNEVLPVKTLKQSEGGVPARTPCMLCGLKREERVTVGDLRTEDSFGEWWVEQSSMHRGCRNFWQKHKDTLRQR